MKWMSYLLVFLISPTALATIYVRGELQEPEGIQMGRSAELIANYEVVVGSPAECFTQEDGGVTPIIEKVTYPIEFDAINKYLLRVAENYESTELPQCQFTFKSFMIRLKKDSQYEANGYVFFTRWSNDNLTKDQWNNEGHIRCAVNKHPSQKFDFICLTENSESLRIPPSRVMTVNFVYTGELPSPDQMNVKEAFQFKNGAVIEVFDDVLQRKNERSMVRVSKPPFEKGPMAGDFYPASYVVGSDYRGTLFDVRTIISQSTSPGGYKAFTLTTYKEETPANVKCDSVEDSLWDSSLEYNYFDAQTQKIESFWYCFKNLAE
ncbi:MAG: hypothetical protein KDD33_10590 [Bdellovibrionales bacterium]|nr:hypothetical protein [Bdellovibrionales bacterium]